MAAMALRNSLEGITLDDLIHGGCEEGGGDIDEDSNGRIAVEGVATVEDGSDDAGSQVTSHVGGDGYVGEAPNHVGVRDADYEGSGGRGYEGVGGVKDCPDYDALSGALVYDWGIEEVREGKDVR